MCSGRMVCFLVIGEFDLLLGSLDPIDRDQIDQGTHKLIPIETREVARIGRDLEP